MGQRNHNPRVGSSSPSSATTVTNTPMSQARCSNQCVQPALDGDAHPAGSLWAAGYDDGVNQFTNGVRPRTVAVIDAILKFVSQAQEFRLVLLQRMGME